MREFFISGSYTVHSLPVASRKTKPFSLVYRSLGPLAFSTQDHNRDKAANEQPPCRKFWSCRPSFCPFGSRGTCIERFASSLVTALRHAATTGLGQVEFLPSGLHIRLVCPLRCLRGIMSGSAIGRLNEATKGLFACESLPTNTETFKQDTRDAGPYPAFNSVWRRAARNFFPNVF